MIKNYGEYQETHIQWIETVPKHWELKRGKSIFYSEKRVNKKGEWSNVLSLTKRGVIRNNIDNPVGLAPKSYDSYQLFEKDDLVFKLIDLENISTSRVGLVWEQGIMSPAYIRLRKRHKNGHIKYYYYQYYSWYLQCVYNNLGAGVRQTITANELLNLVIPVPPEAEQDQIVRYLDWKLTEIDKFIRQKKKQIKRLDDIKKLETDRFVLRGVKEHVFKKTDIIGLEEVPEDWEIIRNKNLFFERTEYSTTGKERLLSVSKHFGVKPSDELSENEQYATIKPAEDMTGYKIVVKNDLVMNIMRARNGSYGISNYDGIVSAAYCVYGIKRKCNTQYIHYLLRSKSIINTYEAYAYGICEHRRRLYADDFLRLYSILPDIDEQNEIVERIENLEKEFNWAISQISREIELVQELRTRIISDVVTGQIDVREVVIPEYDPDTIDMTDDIEDDEDLDEDPDDES